MVLRGELGSRLTFVLAVFLPVLFIAVPTGDAGPLGLATALTAGLAAALVACALQIRLEPAAAPAHKRTVSLRERARLANFLRLRNPDAPGHARPRAPSFGSAAA
ncbi:hypothetical protein SAMN05216266_1444 [Amycolatopsis marina]|uniref:Uncharacterized protein n=1 Tax=Amycolatopsis marina TaxID=490629 RepID=A0A1I1CR23_9PSEU|nr:DUF6412 domain-containing protein [Amycolatopsis marina]SFB64506.1 hypothetical protein SAMN05216266_1444 [Amycolatopsis marina]